VPRRQPRRDLAGGTSLLPSRDAGHRPACSFFIALDDRARFPLVFPRPMPTREHGYPNANQLICDRVFLEQKRLLAYGDHGLKELADLTGFEDATSFVKFFRRHVGLTPIAFRRRLQAR
jgi:AraC-like DNA-binding protein